MRFNPSPPNTLSGLFPHNAPHQNLQSSGDQSRRNVKEGLRHAIHARRALSHNPIIRPEDLAPRNIQFKLTPEEEEKRRVRREKNKLAASKCRNKKREQITNTKQEYEKVMQSNNHMEREIARLKAEKNALQHSLGSHHCALPGRSSGGASSSGYHRALPGSSSGAGSWQDNVRRYH